MTRIRARTRTRKEGDIYAGRMARIFRMLSGMRQKDVAEAFDLSASSYKCLEHGQRRWSVSDIVTVCDMFGIDRSTFAENVMFDIRGVTVQYNRDTSYSAKKQRAQIMAEELAPYGCVPMFQTELTRLGKRFGLIKEFRARGILK